MLSISFFSLASSLLRPPINPVSLLVGMYDNRQSGRIPQQPKRDGFVGFTFYGPFDEFVGLGPDISGHLFVIISIDFLTIYMND